MKFDDLEARLRPFETTADVSVLPEIFMVARIDGRGFTKLTKEVHSFEAPFDLRFHDYMMQTTAHLMNCGFRIVYGYTQSDEISLLFHRREGLFDRKLRKYQSILAGEASARFSLLLGAIGCFDCRISQLPTEQLVIDYFRWRSEDAHRNALSGHCYWALRKEGVSVKTATEPLDGLSTADKNELLFSRGINFNNLPAWQKRGTGLYWESHEKPGVDRRTGQSITARRRRLKIDQELPTRSQYETFLDSLVQAAQDK